jgi:hypothetical protein
VVFLYKLTNYLANPSVIKVNPSHQFIIVEECGVMLAVVSNDASQQQLHLPRCIVNYTRKYLHKIEGKILNSRAAHDAILVGL